MDSEGSVARTDLGITNDREGAGDEQAAQIAVPLFTDTAEPILAATRVPPRHQPDPSRKVAACRNALGSATLDSKAVASSGPIPGM
jgi:hypothetical protein